MRSAAVFALALSFSGCSSKESPKPAPGKAPVFDASPFSPAEVVNPSATSEQSPSSLLEIVNVKQAEDAALSESTPAITGTPPRQKTSDSSDAGAGDSASSDGGGQFKVVIDGQPEGDRALAATFVQGLAMVLNQAVDLPFDVVIHMRSCGGDGNMYYDPDSRTIIACNEALSAMRTVFAYYKPKAEAETAALIAFVGGLFHELGHCLIDVFALPAIGREEDAADQLATIFMLGGPKLAASQDTSQFALTFAEFWLAFASVRDESKKNRYWDEHSIDEVRYYNILCLTYGASPVANQHLVDEGDLPRLRARRCKREYQRIRSAWVNLLKPHLKINFGSDD